MKNLTNLFGIIALVAVIGFSMVSCGGDDGGGGGAADPALNGTWEGTNNQLYIFDNGSFKGYATNSGEVTGKYNTSEGVITLKNSQGKESGNYYFMDDDTLVIGRITYKRPTIDPALVGTWIDVTADRIYYTFNNDGSGVSYYGPFMYTAKDGRMNRYTAYYYWCNYKIEGNTLEMKQYSNPDTYTKQ